LQRFTPPKYGEDRIIHLPAEAVAILKDQRRRQAEQRLAAGGWDDDEISKDLVFRMSTGAAHNDRTIYKAVKAAGKAIGKPELHPHDLRHSYAVAALRSGADVKTVQHNLGHKTAQMTLDVYAAYTEDAGKAGAEKLSEYIKNST
jgi:integrase